MERGVNPLLSRSRDGNESPFGATGRNDREGGQVEIDSLKTNFSRYLKCP